jgi:hypothetical protein
MSDWFQERIFQPFGQKGKLKVWSHQISMISSQNISETRIQNYIHVARIPGYNYQKVLDISEMKFGSRVYLLPLPRPTRSCQVEARVSILLRIGLSICDIKQCHGSTPDISAMPVQIMGRRWTNLTHHGPDLLSAQRHTAGCQLLLLLFRCLLQRLALHSAPSPPSPTVKRIPL